MEFERKWFLKDLSVYLDKNLPANKEKEIDFSKIFRTGESGKIRDMRLNSDGEVEKYAWPGGYPMFYVSKDNETICSKCANEEHFDEDQALVDYDINYEDPAMYCGSCNERIESAYAEPEKCDECGQEIPKDEEELDESSHSDSCSLHPDNIVEARAEERTKKAAPH